MDAMGYLHPRSTLVRIGASLHTGVVDAGYQGKMQCGLVVHNPKGILLAVGARVAQFTVHRMEQAVATGYAGQYMGEGLTDSKPWSVCPKCGKASDLEGNALCATCDFGEDDPPGRPWPPQPEEPEINPKLRVRHR